MSADLVGDCRKEQLSFNDSCHTGQSRRKGVELSDTKIAEHVGVGQPMVAANRRIFEMWLACWSMDEIAEQENVGKATVSEICSEFADLQKANKSDRAAAEHATDFPPS